MNIVSNSSPLIFLSKIGRLHVLEKLFDKVYIAQAVYDETVLSAKSDDITDQIEMEMLGSDRQEIPTRVIGNAVLKRLKKIDKVAWLRFASVYLEFEDLSDFEKLI
jgi:transcriptional repressor NrdR